MKKFRTKIDTPWGPKGMIHTVNDNGFIDMDRIWCNPDAYPDFFEEIQDRTDVEKMAEWLINIACYRTFRVMSDYEVIAKKIIDAGVDVSKLIEKI